MTAIPARLAERLRGYREGRPRLGPETVHIDVTNLCNLDCVSCWNYAPDLAQPKPAAWRNERMASATFVRLLDECVEAGVERIIVSGGGEPFAHPEIDRLIAAVKHRGLALTVITNGTLCDYALLATAAAVPDQMLVNLAAGSRETYAAYHPNQPPETFDRLIADLRTISGRIAINLVQVIHRVNFAELEDMVELAAAVGARCSFKLADFPRGTGHLALSPAETGELLARQIPASRARAEALAVRHNLEAFAAQLAGADDARFARECFAGYLYARVGVGGRIYFCCEAIDVGHADRGSLAAQWQAVDWQGVRERLRRGHFYPGCRRCGKYDMNHSAARALRAMTGAPR